MSFPRYERYKDSGVEWLGEVPEHWQLKRLNCLSSINDEALEENTGPDFEMRYVDISSVSSGSAELVCETMTFKDAPSRARRIVRDGDVLVSTVRTYLRAVAPVTKPPSNLIVSTGFAVIRPGAQFRSEFARYALLASNFIEEVIARSTGVSYPAINAHDLGFIKIPIPCSPAEQLAVSTFLSVETAKIDALIEEQQRLIELLKEKRQAVISHAVTKGLNPNAPMRQSGISWIGHMPAHWQTRKLAGLVSTRKGIAFKAEDFAEDGIPVVKASDIKSLTVKSPTTWLPADYVDRYPQAVLRSEELILSTVGSTPDVRNSAVGQLGRLPPTLSGSLLNQNTVVFMPSSKLLAPSFLFLVLQTLGYRDHLDLHAHGTANQASLIITDMLDFSIPLPEVGEQTQIANLVCDDLSRMDLLTANVRHAIELLHERRSGVISACVTGKIDVRNFVPSEVTELEEAYEPA